MIHWISSESLFFPCVKQSNEYGVIAVGGDLTVSRLLLAYSKGIFPWYNPNEPIVWHCPDPRFVLYPQNLYVSKSMKKVLKSDKFKLTINKAFDQVISSCRYIKRKADNFPSWITDDMEKAYNSLNKLGYAHSVEVWEEGILVGGLYGIILGKIFYGESMFSTVSNASKFGFIKWVEILKDKGFYLIDCQQETTHLASLGANNIPREKFIDTLKEYADFSQTSFG